VRRRLSLQLARFCDGVTFELARPLTSAFYRRWIWANAWSELLGLGSTFALGLLLFPQLESASIAVTLAGALFAVVGGAMLEGGVVGWAQARVLREECQDLPPRRWVWATVLGAGLAWFLGMIPSTVMTVANTMTSSAEVSQPGTGTMLLLAAGMGSVLGPVLSLPQYFVLKAVVNRANRWIVANAVAWAVGMAVIFSGISSVPNDASALRVGLTILPSFLAAGALVGAVHGPTLLRLLESQRR
jgi:hypothetical protein